MVVGHDLNLTLFPEDRTGLLQAVSLIYLGPQEHDNVRGLSGIVLCLGLQRQFQQLSKMVRQSRSNHVDHHFIVQHASYLSVKQRLSAGNKVHPNGRVHEMTQAESARHFLSPGRDHPPSLSMTAEEEIQKVNPEGVEVVRLLLLNDMWINLRQEA
ncbi:hypothetical protein J6590_090961 [Homalodisca vitripennis]|nr:hypothetical protein J6590_090961 [Homalodisca vitripennis]